MLGAARRTAGIRVVKLNQVALRRALMSGHIDLIHQRTNPSNKNCMSREDLDTKG